MNASIHQYISRHELTLQGIMKRSNIPSKQIRDAMNYVLFPGGKRLRPLLVYLCGEILDVPLAILDSIAASIELIHCYSLVHDDLPAMDNDDLRRGKPSCHKAFDEATAILVGDGMQALAIEILLTDLPLFLNLSQVVSITQELVKASGVSGMVSGQCLDLLELGGLNITESRLKTIHHLKTGKLILACINMVLTAAKPDKSTTTLLQQFALHLGLVFQMQDDYLDYYAKEDSLGKGRASDVANKKKTFASLYQQEELLTLINEHFHETKKALAPLGLKSQHLLNLVESLEKRCNCNLISQLE